jgi:putative addiction module component (TIGR02574 family)
MLVAARVARISAARKRAQWPVASGRSPEQTVSMARTPVDEILAQPVSDRLRAVEAIWESIVQSPELLSVPQSQRDELDRRLKLHREDPDAASPWEEVRARLLGRE